MNRHVGWEDKELLGMDQYEMVRTAHRVYKKSIRRISRETGHTRRTIPEGVGRAGAQVSA